MRSSSKELSNNSALTQPMGPADQEEEEEHDHGSWILRLESDSDEPAGSEPEEAGLNSTPLSESRPLPGASGGNVLVPPPLLQMRVGGATVVGGPTVVGASRPMPRLVPLGLRGTLPS